MIALIITLSLLFTWLLHETQWLKVRLPQFSEQVLQKTERFEAIICKHGKTHYGDNWRCHKIPARTIKAFGHTLSLAEGCNICRAKLLKEVAKAQKLNKSYQAHSVTQFPTITEALNYVVSGQHKERESWVAYDGKTYTCDKFVCDYKPIFGNCLVPKTWLRKHHKNVLPEPTIELIANGKSLGTVNGDFKKGMIKQLIKSA